MKKYFFFVILFASSINSYTQFSGVYAPSNWTLVWLLPPTNGSVDTASAPVSLSLTGDNDCSGDIEQFGDYSITVPSCGLFSFDFSWINSDVSTAEESYYSVNGVYYLISNPSAVGSIGPILLAQGDVISFAVNSPGPDCGGTGTLTITNFVGPIPVQLNATPSQPTACAGGLITVLASNANSYIWSTGASGTVDSVIVTVSSDTTVFVTGTDLNGCMWMDSVNIDMINCAGISEQESLSATIYPNPSTDFIFIESSEEDLQFGIYDISGKQVQNGNLSKQRIIPVDNLTKGVYILTLGNKGLVKRMRFIKN